MSRRYGIICGNGRFPILALEAARQMGDRVVAVGIQGEATDEIGKLAESAHWITIAELTKLIEILKSEGVSEVMFCGQVKHASIFSSLRPDWRLAKLLLSLPEKNTDALIGGVRNILRGEGIELVDSTRLLKPLLADSGVMTARKPTEEEEKDIAYGRKIAAALSGLDLGQSVAVSEKACVALEAMEGTDAMLRRAANLVNGRRLTLVKGSRRRGHLLFDVPVVGLETVETMRETGATALAVDAGRTLMLDRREMINAANEYGISVAGYATEGE